CARKEEFAYW
nr:immunoglobulin heavy chain junction region [Mus musculus]MBK4197459.1 immunoglobulin heavy chain junction region [Mus musculus]